MTKTHDYTRRGWGHDFYTIKAEDGGQRLICGGWGRGISAGDFLIMPNGDGTTRYAVQRIDYRIDPPDMWSADLVFAPRPERGVMTNIEAALSGVIDLWRDLRASPHIQAGTFWELGGQILCRHESEFWTAVAGAHWHVWRAHCPTWDDATECRCMLGGDA